MGMKPRRRTAAVQAMRRQQKQPEPKNWILTVTVGGKWAHSHIDEILEHVTRRNASDYEYNFFSGKRSMEFSFKDELGAHASQDRVREVAEAVGFKVQTTVKPERV